MTGEAQEPVVLKLGAIRRWYGGRTGHYDETGEWVSGKNWNYPRELATYRKHDPVWDAVVSARFVDVAMNAICRRDGGR